MWHNHPFSQRNKTSNIAMEVKFGVNWKEGLDNILKSWGRQYRVVFNIGGIRNTRPTMTHIELFYIKDVLIFLGKVLKILVQEFIFSKAAGCFKKNELNHSYF